MDRYVRHEFECGDCEMNYEIRHDKSYADECICCPFCGSVSIKKIDPDEKDDGDDEESRPDLRDEE
jgi:hydrogenase maturation factor HypF (carbamoyltransferase family)